MAENNKRNNKRNNDDKFRSNKNKKRNYGSKVEAIVVPPSIHSELVEYKMSKAMAEDILKTMGGKAGSPQHTLCNYVNTYFGIKGYCVKVVAE
jgi:hypothetical protein